MFNGLSKDKAEAYLKPYAPSLLEFVEAIWADKAGQDDGEAGGGPATGWAPATGRWASAMSAGQHSCPKLSWHSCSLRRQGQPTSSPAPPPPSIAPPAGVLKASAALLGDVASTLSGTGPLFQQKPYVQAFLQQLAQDSTTADTANWASQMIQKALRG